MLTAMNPPESNEPAAEVDMRPVVNGLPIAPGATLEQVRTHLKRLAVAHKRGLAERELLPHKIKRPEGAPRRPRQKKGESLRSYRTRVATYEKERDAILWCRKHPDSPEAKARAAAKARELGTRRERKRKTVADKLAEVETHEAGKRPQQPVDCAYRSLTVEERVQSGLVVDPETDCHLWQRGRTAFGFAAMRIGGKLVQLNRWVWQREHGRVPGRLRATCGRKRCLNVAHWEEI
jgi:hypothetical protein